ncbi:MAG: 5-formyltetrahydrofolate cyclo-ligase [Coriobacteriia bacterium]|nr:5-formyltetrahydrofolate cyclo-ligase [Coriobacteriia bacterium]
MNKDTFRREARKIRDQMSRGTIVASSEALVSQLLTLPFLPAARVVAAYEPMHGEISPSSALERLSELARMSAHGHKVQVALPHITGVHEMEMRIVCADTGTDMSIDVDELDVVLVPGVAFSTQGDRLGYGKGFYDRFLTTLPPHVVTIGLTYDETLFDELPTEPHDRRVAYVVTPTRVIAGVS